MTCKHHWHYPEANGPTSLGVCQICGDRKEAFNSLPSDKTPSGVVAKYHYPINGRMRMHRFVTPASYDNPSVDDAIKILEG